MVLSVRNKEDTDVLNSIVFTKAWLGECALFIKKSFSVFLLLLTGEFSRNELLNILMFHKINILSPLLHYFQYFSFEEIGEGLEWAYPQMTNMSNISIEYMMAGD